MLRVGIIGCGCIFTMHAKYNLCTLSDVDVIISDKELPDSLKRFHKT